MKTLTRSVVLAAVLVGGWCSIGAQTLPGAVPRPDPLVEPHAPLDPVQKIDAVMAYAEMSCTQLGAALKWHETRAVPQQIAAWNAAMSVLPAADPRASSGDYLRAIEQATQQALRDLLVYDLMAMAVDAKELAADAVDRTTYLQWIKSSRGGALDELSRRVVGSLGLQSGMPVTDWNSRQWKDLVRRRAVEQAERMRLEGVYRSPLSSLAVKRLLSVLGPAQKLVAVHDYLGAVIAAWGPLIDAAGTAARSEAQVVARARELSGLMREGERMRLSYALRCGPDPVADVYVAGRFSGTYEGPLGRIDFSADGSYVFLSSFGTRTQGRHRLESGRVFLTGWHGNGAEQWFHLRQGCLIEVAFGKEMFCSGRAPKW